jgi:hypothetical protein
MWPGADDDIDVIGPKAGLFTTRDLAGGAAWDFDALGVDTSSTTAGTGIDLGTADPVPQGSLTLMFTGQLDSLPGTNDFMGLIAKRDTFLAANMRWQWVVMDDQTTPANQFRWANQTFSQEFTVAPSTGYHTWVLADDGIGSYLYEDGVLLDTKNDLVFDSDEAAALHIGRSQSNNQEEFHGTVDVVAMWDRPLSAAEVAFISAFPYALFDPRGGKLGVRRRRR